MRSFDSRDNSVTAPKAYVGLFGDNSVAVLDLASNRVRKTIPIPTGPHGLVMTPDGKRVYASSKGDSRKSRCAPPGSRLIRANPVTNSSEQPDSCALLTLSTGRRERKVRGFPHPQLVWPPVGCGIPSMAASGRIPRLVLCHPVAQALSGSFHTHPLTRISSSSSPKASARHWRRCMIATPPCYVTWLPA